jgi:hypothetical protein
MGIHPSRWLQPGYRWLDDGSVKGRYVRGPRLPDFRAQHPTNWLQIEGDIERWAKGMVLDAEPAADQGRETTLL